MATYIYIALFLSVILTVSALDCYKCTDCDSYFSYSSSSDTCTSGLFGALTEPRCKKEITADGVVNRGCLSVTECALSETAAKCSSSKTSDCTICCNKNDCNSASMTTVSMATLAISGVLALLYTM